MLSMSWVLNSEARLLTEQFTWDTESWNYQCGRSNRVKTSLSLVCGCGSSLNRFTAGTLGGAKLGGKNLSISFA